MVIMTDRSHRSEIRPLRASIARKLFSLTPARAYDDVPCVQSAEKIGAAAPRSDRLTGRYSKTTIAAHGGPKGCRDEARSTPNPRNCGKPDRKAMNPQ
jgi:hypothetical protein